MRRKTDIWPTKGQVIGWKVVNKGGILQDSVAKDIVRATEFVGNERAKVVCAILIDEDGFFRKKPALAPGTWVDWENGVSIHWTKVTREEQTA